MSFFFSSNGFLSLCVEALNGDISPSQFHSLVASLKSTGHFAADPTLPSPPPRHLPPTPPPTFQRDDEAFEFDCGCTGSATLPHLTASRLASSSSSPPRSSTTSSSVSLGLLLLPLILHHLLLSLSWPPPPQSRLASSSPRSSTTSSSVSLGLLLLLSF